MIFKIQNTLMLVVAFSKMILTALIKFLVGGPCLSLTIVLCSVQAVQDYKSYRILYINVVYLLVWLINCTRFMVHTSKCASYVAFATFYHLYVI